jgi:hypothetical protein
MTATVTNSGFASKGDATEVRNYPFYDANGAFNYKQYSDALALQKKLSCEFNLCASSIMQAFILAVGAYKQYKMYDQQGDMYEAQKKYLDETREIMKDNYNSLFKPQYQASTGHLWGYVNNWGKGVIETAAACGTRICEYVRDQEVFNRAMAQVPSFVNKAKRIGMRSLKRGQVGICCDNEFRFGALQAGLMTKALNLAERYEDDKALRWNQFYWGRMSGAAAMAGNQYSTAANLVNGASSGVSSVVGQMGQSVNSGAQVAQLGMNALDSKAGFWGGLGGLAGMMAGQQGGSQSVAPSSGMFGGSQPTIGGTPSSGNFGGMGTSQWMANPINSQQGMGPPQDSSSMINGFF